MLTRRDFAARIGLAAAGIPAFHEIAFAQHALVRGNLPKDMVWLNANENPDGPPRSSIQAMREVVPEAWRYHYQEFRDFYDTLARSEDLAAEQILVGAGSTEGLHCAVDAFTSPGRPLITVAPTYESPGEFTRVRGCPVVTVPLGPPDYAIDGKRLVEEARKAGGGVIYVCNPNNPTSNIIPKRELAWLVANLPPQTVLVVDEAYIHFADSPEIESALAYVRQGKDVIVTRTFSKIFGMAGVRAGFACARPDLIARMAPFRNNVISIMALRAVLAAVGESKTLVPERKARLIRTRKEICGWLRQKGLRYIEPQANFLMIDVGRDVRPMGMAMAQKGVAVGRPFPPLDRMLRVSIGTDTDMAKFREVFWGVYEKTI